MRSKSLLIGLIVVLALLAVIGVADAQPPGMPPLKKLSKAERAKARCGVCMVVTKSFESVLSHGEETLNVSPYGHKTDTLIDDALKLVCAVSKDNLLALGFELPTIMEECMDVVSQYDEEFEDLMRNGISDVLEACKNEVPLCKGIKEKDLPRFKVDIPPPTNLKDERDEL